MMLMPLFALHCRVVVGMAGFLKGRCWTSGWREGVVGGINSSLPRRADAEKGISTVLLKRIGRLLYF